MKTAVLFSGGKDSCYAAYLAKKQGYDLACLISIFSENPDSYMFHTTSINATKKQAEVMDLPLIIQKTKGKKEEELRDLKKAIKKAKEKYNISVVVSGALESNYQKSRIEDICKKLNLNSITPLWHKDGLEFLNELIRNKFKVMVVSVSAYPLEKEWLGRIINNKFIEELLTLNKKYKIHLAGEGGEFETLVLNCPLFKKSLKIKNKKIYSTGENVWRVEVEV